MSAMNNNVLVIGELNVDLVLNELNSLPELEKEIIASKMDLTMGSSSAIFANNLSVLGNQVSFLGKMGNDQFADIILNSLDKSGVNTSKIIRSENEKTGITVSINYKNERANITFPGAMDSFCMNDIPDNAFFDIDHMHISSVFLQRELKKDIIDLFKIAKGHNISTSLDTQWDPDEIWDLDIEKLLPYVDVFIPNASEILHLTNSSSITECISKIRNFANIIVIKNSINGATLFDGLNITNRPAVLNNDVIDCIGAGDSFNAGFIHYYLKGNKLNDCLDMAILMGALNTTAMGGIGAFSSKQSIVDTVFKKFSKKIIL